jgi:hypothetical protein
MMERASLTSKGVSPEGKTGLETEPVADSDKAVELDCVGVEESAEDEKDECRGRGRTREGAVGKVGAGEERGGEELGRVLGEDGSRSSFWTRVHSLLALYSSAPAACSTIISACSRTADTDSRSLKPS